MEKKIIRILEEKLVDIASQKNWKKYSIFTNQSLEFISNSPNDHRRFEFDLTLYKDHRLFAVFEIKEGPLFEKLNQIDLVKKADLLFDKIGIDYYICTNGNSFKIINKKYEFRIISNFKELVNLLSEIPSSSQIEKGIKEIVNHIREFISNSNLKSNEEFKRIIESPDFENQLEYIEELGAFVFKGDPNSLDSFENKFFLSLLPKFEDNVVYRYTTLDTLYSMLKFNSFRMNGIAGMNDTTEVNYVEEYLNKVRVQFEFFDDYKRQEINRKYISSCVMEDKKDDLTMWRLYGDESKGVCLEFCVKNENQNAHILLKPVSYGQERRKHDELDLIQSMNKLVLTQINASFVFLTFDVWKHFFKPYDYKVEKEVRLLYVENNHHPKFVSHDWVKTFGDQIFNPYVDFQLNSENFPLFLNKIILGPNSPNKEVNISQLREWIRQESSKDKRDIRHVEVELSRIDNYRKA